MHHAFLLAAPRAQSVHVAMKPNEGKALLAIAKQHLDLDTLDERRSDSLDFHELSVWQIRAALEAAYRAGEKAAQQEKS